MDRVSIKMRAKDRMRENRTSAILPVALLTAILAILGCGTRYFPYVGIASIFTVTIEIGVIYCETEVWHGRSTSANVLWTQSFTNFGRKLGGMLWMALWVGLWSMLCVVPGIVKQCAYSLTPYILARYPGVTARDALRISMRATEGHKADIFVMYLSFLGWMLLSGVTAGIVYVLYAGPYMAVSYSGMCESLLKEAVQKGAVSYGELAQD